VGDVKSRPAQTWIVGNSENESDREHGRHSANDEKIQIPRGAKIAGKDGVRERPVDHRLSGGNSPGTKKCRGLLIDCARRRFLGDEHARHAAALKLPIEGVVVAECALELVLEIGREDSL
jgi:hypothetical protein